MENQNQFGPQKEEHGHKKIVYTIAVLIVAIIIVLILIKMIGREGASAPEFMPTPGLTEEQKLIDNMTATGPSNLTAEERMALERQMTATKESNISEAERARLIDEMTAPKPQ